MASTRTLFIIGLVIGFVAMPALAATFSPAPGDAGKVSDGVPFQSPDGMTVTLTGNSNVTMENLFPASDRVQLNTSAGGNITFESTTAANATIAVTEIEGKWTNVTSVDPNGSYLTIIPADKQQIAVRNDTTDIRVTDMVVDDGGVDFVISGTGTATIRITDLPQTTTLNAVNESGQTVATNTTTANGVVVFNIPTSTQTLSLQTDSTSTPTPTPTATPSDNTSTAITTGTPSRPHLYQHLIAFIGAMWWTKKWLITRPVSRWRFAVSALAGSILWIYVAFTATQSFNSSSGEVIAYQSMPLAYFSTFMAFVSVIGIILGLLLWTEEETEQASENIPAQVRSRLGGD